MGGLEGESEEPLAPPKKKKSQVAVHFCFNPPGALLIGL
jgi:hypothetical protein